MEGTLATIMMFAGNFAPRGWNYCDGSLQSIAENNALFALIGTTYGGDGQVTFALPDLRGRGPVGTGAGPGLGHIVLGEGGGSETVTLTQLNMPAHVHNVQVSVNVNSVSQNSNNPQNNLLATTGSPLYASAAAVDGQLAGMNANAVSLTGGSQPINILEPYLAINYVICMEGIFPTQS